MKYDCTISKHKTFAIHSRSNVTQSNNCNKTLFFLFFLLCLVSTGWLHQWANTVFRGGPAYNLQQLTKNKHLTFMINYGALIILQTIHHTV